MNNTKTYTAQEMRDTLKCIYTNMIVGMRRPYRAINSDDVVVNSDDVIAMLRYAADVVDENAKLKARLEEVVKIASNNSWCEDSGVVETDTCAKLHNSYMSDILRAARGNGGEGK